MRRGDLVTIAMQGDFGKPLGIGMLPKVKLGKDNYYLNTALFQLLDDVGKRKLGET